MCGECSDVSGLHVWFPRDPRSGAGESPLRAVENVSFTLYSGRTLGLIGESGCGKTLTAQALLQLIPAPGRMRARLSTLYGVAMASEITPISAGCFLWSSPSGSLMKMWAGSLMYSA